jgi:hypothetical protein
MLPSQTSHALQPLDIACFKPFKTNFKKERDTTMINRNYIERNKIVLARWVDKTLNQALSRKNIILRFKSIWICPLNPKAMDERTRPNNLYTKVN